MYVQKDLGQAPVQKDCSGWEKDPESFSRVIAKHHILRKLGYLLDVKSMSKVFRIDFSNNSAVYVTLAKVPDFLVAGRWYQTAGAISVLHPLMLIEGCRSSASVSRLLI